MRDMNNEQKDLLLKDLCSRLPYKVKASYYGLEELCDCCDVVEAVYPEDDEVIIGQYGLKVEWVKPYLFPLSSMTDEQRREYDSLKYRAELHTDRYYDVIDIDEFETLQDFYHKYHFDYRGLIPLGLAIDCTNLNIY